MFITQSLLADLPKSNSSIFVCSMIQVFVFLWQHHQTFSCLTQLFISWYLGQIIYARGCRGVGGMDREPQISKLVMWQGQVFLTGTKFSGQKICERSVIEQEIAIYAFKYYSCCGLNNAAAPISKKETWRKQKPKNERSNVSSAGMERYLHTVTTVTVLVRWA